MSSDEPALGEAASALDPAVLTSALAQCPDAVVILDRAGVVRYWNRGAERIFGHRAHEMTGSTLEPVIPERLRERHRQGFAEAVARGSSRYGENDLLAVPAITAEGNTISIEFTVCLLAEGEQVGHVAAVIRDVTARFNREREMRRRLEALESGAAEAAADPA
jgi:PAS domain S-box-containing protein